MAHTYKFILQREDGEQRVVKSIFSSEAERELQKVNVLNLREVAGKLIGREIIATIDQWEKESK
jgi:hypothetical protein